MALQVSPEGVPQRGVPGRLALAAVAIGALLLVGAAVLGKEVAAPPPPPIADLPILSATPDASPKWPTLGWASRPTPEPSPSLACSAPLLERLPGSIPRHPRPLVPTKVAEIAWPASSLDVVVADRRAGLWGLSGGRLVRLDGRGAETGRWSFADDAAFGGWGLKPARDGGVWLYGGRDIRWFDGTAFRDVVPSPSSSIADLADGPDGALWVAAWDAGLFRWDGQTWTAVCPDWQPAGLGQVAIDEEGAVWVVGGQGWGGPAVLARYDGRWTRYDTTDGLPSPIVAAPDGSLWSVTWTGGPPGRVARFDGSRWDAIPEPPIDLGGLTSLAIGDDGAVWVAAGVLPGAVTADGSPITGVSIAKYDAGRWRVYGPEEGLPTADPSSQQTISAVVPAPDGVFAMARDGLYRLEGERWLRVPRPGASAPVGWTSGFVAVSRDEALVAVDDGSGATTIWRASPGRWSPVRRANPSAPMRITILALSPNGVLAAAGMDGLAVLEGDRWTTIATEPFRAVSIARDGRTIFAVPAASGAAVSLPPESSVRFTRTSDGWVPSPPRATAAPTDVFMDVAPLAVAGDGAWLVGSCGGWGPGTPLAMLRNGGWTEPMPLSGPPYEDANACASDIEAAPDGDVWLLMSSRFSSDPSGARPVPTRYRNGTWTTYGPADGYLATLAWHLAVAPDGTVWTDSDSGLWHFDGTNWSRPVAGAGFSDPSVAPDGSVWAIGPTGIVRLPDDVATAVRPLSDAQDAWCSALPGLGAVGAATLRLGIDVAAMEARAGRIAAARGTAEDPAAFAEARRTDPDWIAACRSAYEAAH